jgi:hypothetical protein
MCPAGQGGNGSADLRTSGGEGRDNNSGGYNAGGGGGQGSTTMSFNTEAGGSGSGSGFGTGPGPAPDSHGTAGGGETVSGNKMNNFKMPNIPAAPKTDPKTKVPSGVKKTQKNQQKKSLHRFRLKPMRFRLKIIAL